MNTKSLTRSLGALLAAGSLFLPALRAADAPLVGDAYISSAAPATNFGAATSLVIAPGNAGLVQFDLSAVPGSSTIAKAYLRVYVNKVVAGGTLNFAPRHRVLERKRGHLEHPAGRRPVLRHRRRERGEHLRPRRRDDSGASLAGRSGGQLRHRDHRVGDRLRSVGHQGKHHHQPSADAGTCHRGSRGPAREQPARGTDR